MEEKMLLQAETYVKKNHRRRLWKKIVSAMACIVVFCTVYALILPAVTLEQRVICGMEEHQHAGLCYEETLVEHASAEFVCEPEVHSHTDICCDEEGKLICGLSDRLIHAHDEYCYFNGELICSLPAIEEHVHTEMCYTTHEVLICEQEEIQHVHSDACYLIERGEQLCELEEDGAHTHAEDCFDQVKTLNCTAAETQHLHGTDCYQNVRELSCSLDQIVVHTHGESCCDENGSLICEFLAAEEHVHNADCIRSSVNMVPTEVVICELEEHTHTESCMEYQDGQGILPPDEEPEIVEDPEIIDDLETGEEANSELKEEEIDWDRIADVSNGPVISAYIAPTEDEIEEKVIMRSSTLSLSRFAVQNGVQPRATIQNLQDYINKQNADQSDPSKHASISFRLIDPDTEQSVPQNPDGTFGVVAGHPYIFSLDVILPSGIHPGTYAYSLPKGVYASGGSGKVVTKAGVELGEYSVDSEGNITLTIYDTTDTQSQITILADVGIMFREEYESVTFDGDVKVVITKPPSTDPIEKTEVYKSAVSDSDEAFVDGDGDGVVDFVHWSGSVEGSANSNIVGNTLIDIIRDSQARHHYDEQSMSRGITFTFTDDKGVQHQWTVKDGDRNLSWNRTGWQYTFPQSITCSSCKAAIPLKNTYTYRFNYYTSIDPSVLGEDGKLVNEATFSNKIGIDGDEYEVWHSYTDGSFDIVKAGRFNSETMEFEWAVDVTIPGYEGSGIPMGYWCVEDYMDIVVDSWDMNTNDKAHNAMDVGTVTARYVSGGKAVTESVPNISVADGSSRFAYKVAETFTTTDGTDISYGHLIILLSRCDCTEASCAKWVGGTCHGHTVENGYCSCWTVPESVHFVFEYSHSNNEVLGEYGGSDLRNTAFLYRGQVQWDGSFNHSWTDYDDTYAKIPGLLNKEKLGSNNGYIAKFEITVNEEKLDLSGHEKLEIVDTMSPTLDYIAGTLKIRTVDKAWKQKELVEGKDFSVSYNAATHVMTITLNDPGEVEYILRYDTEINVSNAVGGNYTYYNSAEIELFGISINSDADVTEITGISSTSKQYVVRLNKVDAANNTVAVAGARLGLFDATGKKVFEGVTDKDGHLDFVTSVTAGALLYEHTLYYIQELAAPDGYKLNDDKHWFYFCNGLIEGEKACEVAGCIHNTIGAEYGAKKMPGDNINIQVVNERDHVYVLPETGAAGTTIYTAAGLALMLFSVAFLMYRIKARRREEYSSP